MPRNQEFNWDESEDVKPAKNLFQKWLNGYKEADVNIYTPALCEELLRRKARQASVEIRLNQVKGEIVRCRVKHINPNAKMLLATKALQENQPIIELKGKFMLPCEYMSDNTAYERNEIIEIPTGSFVFLYEIKKCGPIVCVDTRSYGNDARFVRKSSHPNAQIKHCFKKGVIHLYIVATRHIGRDLEITIPNDELRIYFQYENAPDFSIMRVKETTVLRDNSGVVADPNHSYDVISQQPIHTIPSTSTSQNFVPPIKIKLRKKSIAAKQSKFKKLPQKMNTENSRRSRNNRISPSRNGRDVMENTSMEISPSEVVEIQHSETARSKTPCVGCPLVDNVGSDLGASRARTRNLSPENQSSGLPHVGSGQLATDAQLPTAISQQVSNHCMHLAQQNGSVNDKGESQIPRTSNQVNDFWTGVSVGLSTPIYQLVNILKGAEKKCTHCAAQEQHQKNQCFTPSVPESYITPPQDYDTGRDLEGLPTGGNSYSRTYKDVMCQTEPSHQQPSVTPHHFSSGYEERYQWLQKQPSVTPHHSSAHYEETPQQLVKENDNNPQCRTQEEQPITQNWTASSPGLIGQCSQYCDHGHVCGRYKAQNDSQQLEEHSVTPSHHNQPGTEAVSSGIHISEDELEEVEDEEQGFSCQSESALQELLHLPETESRNPSSHVSNETREPRSGSSYQTEPESRHPQRQYFDNMAKTVEEILRREFGVDCNKEQISHSEDSD